MSTLKNVSPLGSLSIPALGLNLMPNDTFIVEDEAFAKHLLEQSSNFVLAVDGDREPETPNVIEAPIAFVADVPAVADSAEEVEESGVEEVEAPVAVEEVVK